MKKNIDEIKKDLKNLEVKIEQYPLGESSHLIDEFFIVGYSDIIKEEKIIKVLKQDIISKNNDKKIKIKIKIKINLMN